jgi:hypothetical protein
LSSMMPGTAVILQAVRLGAVIGIALLVLAAMARLLRIREFDEAFATISERFNRSQ